MIFARLGRSSGFPRSDDINDFASIVRALWEHCTGRKIIWKTVFSFYYLFFRDSFVFIVER